MHDGATFGDWLKRSRQERGLTQDALAEAVGCATQTIRKIEGGSRRPSFQMAERLAQVLGIAEQERGRWMRAARQDADEEAGALPTADEPPERNLPQYLTPFVGRDQEVAQLTALLATAGCRLVTLIGPGGIGKTRLAVEVARAATGFRDGVAFVSLAPIAAPEAIVPAIGDAVGLSFAGAADMTAQLAAFLRERRMLLVLDNIEHLLELSGIAPGLLEQLLMQAPETTLLVTSRERLRIPSAWVVEIGGLAVPPEDAPRSVAYAAPRLFEEHAQRVQHGFRLDAENYAAVAAICRLVGGMPLGIELAATWLRLLSPAEIGAELARNLDAEHLSPGALPARHHSLRAVVDHSWQLLSEMEQAALRQLSVFQGGFTREAAAEVAGAGLATLASLADKSLVRRAGPGRFDLHEILRQYAAARLREAQPARTATLDRHAGYYARWVGAREDAIQGTEQARALAEISAEIDNVRAAWQWALSRHRLDDIACAAETLTWFMEFRSWYREGVALFAQAVAALRERPDSVERRRVLGLVLGSHAYLLSRLGDFGPAWAAVSEAAELLETTGTSVVRARVLTYQGMLAFQRGAFEQATTAFAAARALAGTDSWTLALNEAWNSLLTLALGDLEESERLFRSSLARYQLTNNPRCLVFCIAFCGFSLIELRKLDEAEPLLQECLALAARAEDRMGIAMTLSALGLVSHLRGALDAASYMLREAAELLDALGDRWAQARALTWLGDTLLALDGVAEAGAAYRKAFALAAGAAPVQLAAAAGLARLYERAGRCHAALTLGDRILADAACPRATRAQLSALRTQLLDRVGAEAGVALDPVLAAAPLAAVIARLDHAPGAQLA